MRERDRRDRKEGVRVSEAFVAVPPFGAQSQNPFSLTFYVGLPQSLSFLFSAFSS
jgi:hypothetical protein